MKLNTLILVIILFSFYSCKKEDNKPVFPLQVNVTALEQGETIVYTKDGKVENTSDLTEFISEKLNDLVFNLSLSEMKVGMGITFLSENTAKFSYMDNYEFEVKKDNDQFMFYYEGIIKSQDGYSFFLTSLPFQKFKTSSTFIPSLMPSYKVVDTKVAYGDYKMLRVPVLSFVYLQYNTVNEVNTRSITSGYSINEFNDEFLTSLKGSDVLIIKQSWLTLKK